MDDIVDALVTAPLGAALLDRVEHAARCRRDPSWFEPFVALPDSRDDDVAAGADWAGTATTAEVRLALVDAADHVGPWTANGHTNAARSLELAPGRAAIAAALLRRTDGPLGPAPMAAEQWWWTDSLPDLTRFTGPDRLGTHFAWVTAPRGGIWTTSPVDLSHEPEGRIDVVEQLTDLWEVVFGPLAVWALRAHDDRRIYEVHSPADWCALVRRHPTDATAWVSRQGSWELTARTFVDGDPAAGLTAPAHRPAVRRGWRRLLLPDWQAVADTWDAVHLSWLGVITTEGHVMDLDDGDVTIVRNWGSERTTWLTPRFDVVGEIRRDPTEPRWENRDGWTPVRTADEERTFLTTLVDGHAR